MPNFKIKPASEIQRRIRDLINRHRKKYIKRYLEPCVGNCKGALSYVNPELADQFDYNEDRCTFCKSKEIGACADARKFQPRYTKEELEADFREELKDFNILSRDYRDLCMLLWVIGSFDEEKVDEQDT